MSSCIIVSGFHRSGTSMTMQALYKAGVHIGDNLIGANPFNVDGHFENSEIVALHDKLLAEHNCDWLATEFSSTDTVLFNQDTISKAHEIVSTLNQQPIWGFKDPRSSLFLRDWQKQIPKLFVVVVFRHYSSCIQSMRIRAARQLALTPSFDNSEAKLWLDPSIGLQSWVTYNQHLVDYCVANSESVLVVQQEAIVNGFPLVQSVNQLANVRLNTDADTGISASKASGSVKLPWPEEHVQDKLIKQADALFDSLTRLANSSPVQVAYLPKRREIMADLPAKMQEQLSRIDFIEPAQVRQTDQKAAKRLVPINSKLPLYAFDEKDIETFRARLRSSLRNPQPTPAATLIKQYENAVRTTHFGEMLLAEKAIVNQDYSKAKRILFNARNLEPKDRIEPYLHGLIEEHFGNFISSSEYFATAMRNNPENAAFAIAHIRLLRKLEEHRKALKVTQTALTVIGRNLQLEVQQASLLDIFGEQSSAIEVLERALNHWPKNIVVLNKMYKFTEKAGDSTSAEQYFKQFAAQKIRQNSRYSSDILHLFSSMMAESDKHELWGLIDKDLNKFLA